MATPALFGVEPARILMPPPGRIEVSGALVEVAAGQLAAGVERRGSGFSFTAPSPLGRLSGRVKRAIDVLLSGVLLMLLIPVMVVVAIAIKLDSPGPLMVEQHRIGRGLRPFRLYKFRSMVADAATRRPEIAGQNEATWPLFKIRQDPRVTRVGRVLRQYSLDEILQLVNILQGHMSLVGPRPPLPEEFEADYVRQCQRLRSVPGLTGLWQVSGRSDLSYDEMVRLDLRYSRQWSLAFDLSILFRTIAAVLSGKGAY